MNLTVCEKYSRREIQKFVLENTVGSSRKIELSMLEVPRGLRLQIRNFKLECLAFDTRKFVRYQKFVMAIATKPKDSSHEIQRILPVAPEIL